MGVREAALELGESGVQVGGLVGDEAEPVAGVAGEVVAEGLGGAEHAEEAVPEGFGADEGVEESGQFVGRLRLGEPYEPEEGQVGVGGRPEGVEQHRIGAYGCQRVGVEQPGGGGGVGETAAEQPDEGAAPASRDCHPAASRGCRCPALACSGVSLAGAGVRLTGTYHDADFRMIRRFIA